MYHCDIYVIMLQVEFTLQLVPIRASLASASSRCSLCSPVASAVRIHQNRSTSVCIGESKCTLPRVSLWLNWISCCSWSPPVMEAWHRISRLLKFPDPLVKNSKFKIQIVNNSWPAKRLSNIRNLFQICAVSCLYQRCDKNLAKLYCTATAALGRA